MPPSSAATRTEQYYDNTIGPDTLLFCRQKQLKTSIIFASGSFDDLDWIDILPASSTRGERTAFIVTDQTVGNLYASDLQNCLETAHIRTRLLTIDDGEVGKSINSYIRTASDIIEHGVDKNSFIFGLGGGVVNNVAGVCAATIYRGIGLIQIPTTVLAQADAAIDFKQAVNLGQGKNLVGAYYPAHAVIVMQKVLETLDERNVRNGFAEILKHALLQDTDFLRYIASHNGHMTDSTFLKRCIRKCIDLKLPTLNGDPKDDLNEMLPQYGHAVGHAIEYLSGYSLLHGEAIAIGICISAEVALRRGICSEDTVSEHYDAFRRLGLPLSVPDSISTNDLIDMIRRDKHYTNHCEMVLPKAIGQIAMDGRNVTFGVTDDELSLAIEVNRNRR
jgi:3-dehydroquinate synthase